MYFDTVHGIRKICPRLLAYSGGRYYNPIAPIYLLHVCNSVTGGNPNLYSLRLYTKQCRHSNWKQTLNSFLGGRHPPVDWHRVTKKDSVLRLEKERHWTESPLSSFNKYTSGCLAGWNLLWMCFQSGLCCENFCIVYAMCVGLWWLVRESAAGSPQRQSKRFQETAE